MYLLSCLSVVLAVSSGQPDADKTIPDAHRPMPDFKDLCSQTAGCKNNVFDVAGQNVKCYGTFGCVFATFDVSDANIVCAGAATCYGATQTGTSDRVLCSGYKACEKTRGAAKEEKNSNNGQSAALSAVKEVICQGLKACTLMAGGISAPVIRCDGDLTCSNKPLPKKPDQIGLDLAASDELFCQGKMACAQAQIETMYAYCDGDGACVEALIQAPEVECYGKRACALSKINPMLGQDINTVFKVEVYGYLGAAGSVIGWPDGRAQSEVEAYSPADDKKGVSPYKFVVNAYGAKSLVRSEINNYGKPFRLRAYGYRAMGGSNLTCSDSVLCKVECKALGCAGLKIVVKKTNDATFSIEPEACDPRSPDYVPSKKDGCSPPTVLGTKCPYIQLEREGVPCWAGIRQLDMEEEEAIDQEMEEHQAEIDESIEEQESEYDDYQFLNDADDAVIEAVFDSYLAANIADKQELHVAAVTPSTSSSSSTTTTLSTIIVSNLVTALSVVTLLAIAFWCYAKHQANKGDYKGLPQ